MIEKLLRKQSKLDLTISERRHSYQSNRYNHQNEIYSWKGKLVLVREKIALQRKLYNIALIFFAKLFSQRVLLCKEKAFANKCPPILQELQIIDNTCNCKRDNIQCNDIYPCYNSIYSVV